MKELKFNIKYLFNRKELYFAFLIIMWINLIYIFTQFMPGLKGELYPALEECSLAHNITTNLLSLMYILVYLTFPLVCNMVLGDSSWRDIHENTGNILYPRLNMKKVIVTRWLLSILVPFLMNFFVLTLSYFVLNGVFIESFTDLNLSLAFDIDFNNIGYLGRLVEKSPLLYISIVNAKVSLFIGLLSGFGYSISFFLKNKISVYFSVLLLQIINDLIFHSIANLYLIAVENDFPYALFLLRLGNCTYTSQLLDNDHLLPTIYLFIFSTLMATIPLLIALKRKDQI